MAIPLKILNRLRLGRDIAAEVTASQPGNLAWVYVYPLLDSAHGFFERRSGEGQVIGFDTGNPIKGFLVRRLEADSRAVQNSYEYQHGEIFNPFSDDRFVVSDEEELQTILQRWIIDFSNLHVPEDVGYYFERGPNLID